MKKTLTELQKINRLGQVTIPLAIRKEISLKEGDFVSTTLLDDGVIVIRPIEKIIFKTSQKGGDK